MGYAPPVRLVSPAEHIRMPWKNGAGVTREIVVEPAKSERFSYRLSIADVATDGPFSRFEGYDRHIVLLDGVGMTIHAGVHGLFQLVPFAPRSFSGDWEVTGTLESGAVRDLNLIVDRALASSTLEVIQLVDETVVRASTCIAYVLEGSLENAGVGDTLIAEGELALVPEPSARIAVGRIFHRVG